MLNHGGIKISSINYTFDEEYEVLNRNFLNSLVDCKISIIGHKIKKIEGERDAYERAGWRPYSTHQFRDKIKQKLEKIIISIRDNQKYAIIWSDVDIVFLKPFIQIHKNLLKIMNNFELAISPEWKNYLNSGFFVCFCNQNTLKFFSKVLEVVEKAQVLEQPVMNAMLGKKFYDTNKFDGIKTYEKIKWTTLPETYWNLTCCDTKISRETLIIHSNWMGGFKNYSEEILTGTFAEKKKQMLDFFQKQYNDSLI